MFRALCRSNYRSTELHSHSKNELPQSLQQTLVGCIAIHERGTGRPPMFARIIVSEVEK